MTSCYLDLSRVSIYRYNLSLYLSLYLLLYLSYQVLDESIAFLEGELLKRGVITEEGVRKLKKEALEDMSDLDNSNIKSWAPENYLNGKWRMKPSLMD